MLAAIAFFLLIGLFAPNSCFLLFQSHFTVFLFYFFNFLYILFRFQKEEALNFRVAKANEVFQLEKVLYDALVAFTYKIIHITI